MRSFAVRTAATCFLIFAKKYKTKVFLTDERDGERGSWDGVGDHEQEDGEREQHGDAERDLLSGVRRQTEPDDHEDVLHGMDRVLEDCHRPRGHLGDKRPGFGLEKNLVSKALGLVNEGVVVEHVRGARSSGGRQNPIMMSTDSMTHGSTMFIT